MKNLPLPSTQKQEVLYELLNNQTISVRQMMADTGMLHVKARILDLRRIGLNIDLEMVKTKNKYGRTASFGQWSINPEEKEKASEMYLKMIKNDK